ncbi:MAG: undecaprenyl-diphosphate phosphatase [Phycisphaerales bacterium]
MQWWHAVILGLVEGITEYLPVSSTGHLIIAGDLMGLKRLAGVSKEALDGYDIVIQGGAILAVLGLYWPRFVQMLMGLLGRDRAGLRLLVNVGIAFVPAAAVGLLVGTWVKAHLFRVGPVVAALVVGGVFMILVDVLLIRPARRRGVHEVDGGAAGADTMPGRGLEEMTPRNALLVGCMQILALWPGTSRSMMTISGGVIAGLRPAAAAEFSFLLGMPTLLAASLYELYKNLRASKAAGTPNLFEEIGVVPTVVGMVVAAVSAAVAVKWLVGFLNRHGLVPFGVYRIVAGGVLWVLVWKGLVSVGQ